MREFNFMHDLYDTSQVRISSKSYAHFKYFHRRTYQLHYNYIFDILNAITKNVRNFTRQTDHSILAL